MLSSATVAPAATGAPSPAAAPAGRQCLKRKAMYEKNLEVLENQALNLEARARSHLAPRRGAPLTRPRLRRTR